MIQFKTFQKMRRIAYSLAITLIGMTPFNITNRREIKFNSTIRNYAENS
ncbi:hypothetical protein SAMN05216326_102174 [Nitrosomonas marina]|uniref:Uncharacterized protein n=1 Tax=Nitrosomonas marina TaxID=917 RepID=A0A1H9YUD2_9PROT|nr:hypothetical protein SAMN05216326_102174 [Nitrosomonas marina]